jgi:hypothetical protein
LNGREFGNRGVQFCQRRTRNEAALNHERNHEIAGPISFLLEGIGSRPFTPFAFSRKKEHREEWNSAGGGVGDTLLW